MANAAAATTVWNCPNYIGELYLIGANQTPFLNMIGGLQGGMVKTVQSQKFATAQPWGLEAASQPAITETTSKTAPTPTTYVRGQDDNTTQIFQEGVNITYSKMGNGDTISGLSLAGQPQPVQDEKDFQIQANLKQVNVDVEYTFLNGVYQAATDAGTAAKSRGIITACSTNAVAAGSIDLSTDLMDQLIRTMAANGAIFNNMVIFTSALDVQRLNDLYGYAPTDRNVGGTDIKQLALPLIGDVGIVWAPHVPAGSLLIADLSVCHPVFKPVPGKGGLFYEDLAKTGAAENGQLYGEIGLDYGPEELHGKITGLTTT